MKVTIAEACGFCYGVRRAVDMASQAETGTKTLGPIIHNPQVVARLSAQGVAPVDSLDEVGDGETVLIRSHGVGPSVYEEASRRGHTRHRRDVSPCQKAQQDAKKSSKKEKI